MVIGFIPFFFTFYYYIKLIRISNEYRRDSIRSLQASQKALSSGKDESSGHESSERAFISSSDSSAERTVRQEKQAKRVTRVARMLGLIMTAYTLSSYPPFIVYLIYSFWPEVGIRDTVFFYMYPWVTFSNSAVNPWIYFCFTKELRKSTLNLILSHTAWYDSTHM